MSINHNSAEKQQTSSTTITQTGGDNANQFGQIFGDINSKNVYQLLSTKAVIIILMVLGAVVVSFLSYQYINSQPYVMEEEDFNIVVAKFGKTSQGWLDWLEPSEMGSRCSSESPL